MFMTDYVPSALFIYTEDSRYLLDQLRNNTFGVDITPVAFDGLMQDPEGSLENVGHVVVSGPLDIIKTVMDLAMKYGFSIGIIPAKGQINLRKYYSLPSQSRAALDLALQKNAQKMDLVLCNGKIMLFKATIGRIPLIDAATDIGTWQLITLARRRLKGLRLLPFGFTADSGRKIETVACGCMVFHPHPKSRASRVVSRDSSFSDGMISLLIAAPFSISAYLQFLIHLIRLRGGDKRIPSSIGYIKSPQIRIETEKELELFIDGDRASRTPVHCKTIPGAVSVNVGMDLCEGNRESRAAQERLDIQQLPVGNKVKRAQNKSLKFFAYASEERFRDLFLALRDDARVNSAYVILMILSTLLATVGLYLNSASVVIGAMLLAPLMSPIVSIAMGVLRQDQFLLISSAQKIVLGIVIALSAAAVTTLLFPHKPVTDEMMGRLNPSLLDLGVAIFAGIAGAYTKSYKEILSGLAGVAIAVALVPPLAVAGIGLGRWDHYVFGQAFLLFTTNLVGIIVAAAITFRVLGYAAAVKNKRMAAIVLVALALITVPLYLSYDRIVNTLVFEKNWQHERFLVNGKYLIVRKATLFYRGNKDVINMEIFAREQLTRGDLDLFKSKIQSNFPKKLTIRADIIYIL